LKKWGWPDIQRGIILSHKRGNGIMLRNTIRKEECMGRSLVLSMLVVTMGVWVLGCGGQPEFAKTAPTAKPIDIGDPATVAMGATLMQNGQDWIVKTDVNGEKRIYVLINRAPGTTEGVQYDPEQKQFYSKDRSKKYDERGNALHTIAKGPNAGQPAASMQIRPVALDPKTGHIMLSGNKSIAKGERDNKAKGAYIVAP
jgi:hypothetical protein